MKLHDKWRSFLRIKDMFAYLFYIIKIQAHGCMFRIYYTYFTMPLVIHTYASIQIHEHLANCTVSFLLLELFEMKMIRNGTLFRLIDPIPSSLKWKMC